MTSEKLFYPIYTDAKLLDELYKLERRLLTRKTSRLGTEGKFDRNAIQGHWSIIGG